jgi:HPt (histidine-containing phosphotransfer) domain-containing protein
VSTFTLEPLLELFDHDIVEVGKLLSSACGSIAEDIAAIRESYARHDGRDVSDRAHRIKGTSAAIGAHEVCAAASSLETHARDAARPEAARVFEALVAVAEQLTADVSSFRASFASAESDHAIN